METHPLLTQKKRDEAAFRAAQVEIVGLRAQAAAGEMVLAYCDEAGFSQVHPNRSAWTPKGARHLIPAIRGKRLNVLAAMLSTGEPVQRQNLAINNSGNICWIHWLAQRTRWKENYCHH